MLDARVLLGACLLVQSAVAQLDLTLVHWGDLHGRFSANSGRGGTICEDPAAATCYGGLARLATSCKGAKEMNPATLCLDTGDSFSGAYWAENDPDFSYLAAMNIFTDAYVIGNHDFDLGLEYLSAFIDAAEFPVLGACNMDTSGEPLLNGKVEKWATFELGGKNVAVLGYTNIEESQAMAGVTGNLEFYDHTEEELGMAACIAEFKAENPGEWVIGILSSAGVDGDQALIKTLNAGGTTDVTWVVGGHDHDPFFQNKESFCLAGTGTGAAFMCNEPGPEMSRYEYPLDVQSAGGQMWLMHAGWGGKYAGQAQLTYAANGQLAGATGVNVPMGAYFNVDGTAQEIPDDEQVAATIAPDLQAVIASRTETIANLPFPLDVVKPDIFVKEAVAGGVLCQALLWSAQNMGFTTRDNNPVVCLQNSATIRRTLAIGAAGEVSVAAIEEMMPPEEGLSLTIMELPPSNLKLALENSVSALNTALGEEPDGRFLHVGAMQYNYNVTGAAYAYNRTSDTLASEGSRITDMLVDCAEITAPTVRVIMNNQLAAGVDAYFSLENGTEILSFGPTLGEALAAYLQAAVGPDGVIYTVAEVNTTCNATGNSPFAEVPSTMFAVAPISAAAAAPPPGMAAPAPTAATPLDGDLEAGTAANSPTSAGAAQEATPATNVTSPEPGSDVGGLHALSAAAVGALALTLSLVA